MWKIEIKDNEENLIVGRKQFYDIGDIEITLGYSEAGSCKLKIYPTDPIYDRLEDEQRFRFYFYEDDSLVFAGDVQDCEKDIYGVKELYLTGFLSWLNNYAFKVDEDIEYSANIQLTTFIERILNGHTSLNGIHRIFYGYNRYVGEIYPTYTLVNNHINLGDVENIPVGYFTISSGVHTALDVIKQAADSVGAYIYLTRDPISEEWYLNAKRESEPENVAQTIIIGQNVISAQDELAFSGGFGTMAFSFYDTGNGTTQIVTRDNTEAIRKYGARAIFVGDTNFKTSAAAIGACTAWLASGGSVKREITVDISDIRIINEQETVVDFFPADDLYPADDLFPTNSVNTVERYLGERLGQYKWIDVILQLSERVVQRKMIRACTIYPQEPQKNKYTF